jgi:hypothetical protein
MRSAVDAMPVAVGETTTTERPGAGALLSSICQGQAPARNDQHLSQPRLPLSSLLPSTGRLEPSAIQPGQAAVISRHELPGRIVLTIGLVRSSLCVVGLIILLVG